LVVANMRDEKTMDLIKMERREEMMMERVDGG
jgi:hypothetical protein